MTSPLVKPHKRKLNLQAAFNIAYRWAQTHDRCASVGGACFYRQGRNACIIGAMIPDKLIEGIEGSIDVVIDYRPAIKDLFTKAVTISELEELQICHDLSGGRDGVIRELKSFAKRYGLKVPRVTKLKA